MEFDARAYLKGLIEAGEITAVKIASDLDCSQTTVYRYISGKPVHRRIKRDFDKYASDRAAAKQTA